MEDLLEDLLVALLGLLLLSCCFRFETLNRLVWRQDALSRKGASC